MFKNKYAIIGIITLVLTVGVIGVKASENKNINDLIELAKVVNEGNSDVIMNAIKMFGGNNMFGASGTRFPNGISADSTSPSAGEVRGTTITVTDDLTVSDAKITCFDMTFADATTTPVAIAATSIFASGSSTIFSFTYGQTGVSTSTIAVDCGVAADAFTSSDTLIDGISTATSTLSYLAGGYGTNGKINQVIGPNQYITCTVTGDITAGVTNTGNTYAGTATVCAVQ